MSESSSRFDIAIVGGGIVGLAIAVRLSALGRSIVVVHAPPARTAAGVRDGRTAALLAPAVDFLRRQGIWERVGGEAAPLKGLRIVNLDEAGRADADVTFHAHEIGVPAFGYNIPNDALRDALLDQVAASPSVTLESGRRLQGLAVEARQAALTLDCGSTLEAALVIGADGRGSVVRQAARIGTTERVYGQTALVCSFTHERPHQDTSIELHRPGGPFTMVPLAEHRSSLVWVELEDVARHLKALDDRGFAAALEERVAPWLGRVSEVSPRQCFPVRAMLADRLIAPRVALAGEAAHALSPIGAQGLNLSLRDVEALGVLFSAAAVAGDDPGSNRLLNAYASRRAADVRARFHAVDGLNRAVASGMAPLRLARGFGLRAVEQVPALRRQLMRAMMDPVTLPGPLARLVM